MKLANATHLHSKSGGAKPRDLQFPSQPIAFNQTPSLFIPSSGDVAGLSRLSRLSRPAVEPAVEPAVGRMRSLLSLMVLVPLLIASGVHGQQRPTRYQVEATYLYNFSQFVVWPASQTAAANAFNICVLGQDPFGPALASIIADETVAGKSVAARRIPTPQEAVDCRVLFISTSESGRLKEILTTLRGTSILTVSELPEFTRHGGMVQFLLVDDRVRFEVNLAAAQQAGLTLSSQLLKVATNVTRTSPLGD